MLKQTTIAGREILLRSTDGRNFFQKPSDLLAYRRQRAKLREELRREWDDIPMRELWMPSDTYRCGVKL